MTRVVRKVPQRKEGNKERKTIFFGFDETNHKHKKLPEIIVSVSSLEIEDIQRRKMKKQRPYKSVRRKIPNNNYFDPLPLEMSRDYSFLIAQASDYERHGEDFQGIVTASLIYGEVPCDIEEIYLAYDGRLPQKERERIKDLVSEIVGFDRETIKLRGGPGYDTLYPIVNLADAIAYKLFQTKTLEELSLDKKRKSLLY